MIGNLMGGDGLIVLIVALVVLVGGSQLPKIARNVGLAGKEFRKAQSEAEAEQAQKAAQDAAAPASVALPAAAPAAPPAAAPAPQPATAAAPQAASGDGEGTISLTPAQLDALLKAREQQGSSDPGSN